MGSHGEQRGSEMARGSGEHMCVREEKVVKSGLTQNMIFSPAEVFLNERKNLEMVSGQLVKEVWNYMEGKIEIKH